jgi:hypothetical protein
MRTIVSPDLAQLLVDIGFLSEAEMQALTNRAEQNLSWLSVDRAIWVTGMAAVGICPENKDFLVFTDLKKKVGVRVRATDAARKDFYTLVFPAIQAHRTAFATLTEQEWTNGVHHLLTSVVPAVVDNKVGGPRRKKASTHGISATADRVVRELEAFIGRHESSLLGR